MLSDLRIRLRALFDRRAMEQDLDDELRFHIEQETEKYMRGGLPRDEAERKARIAFGGVDRIKEDARDARGVTTLDSLTQDLRYAWRGVRAQKGFSAAIILTLALGIGANTAMFGILDRLLFRPPAYLKTPDRVHRVFLDYVWDTRQRAERTMEYTRFVDLNRWTNSFDRTAAIAYRNMAVGTGDAAREQMVAAASATVFDLFDARPVLGRFFSAEEDHMPKGAEVAVLGYDYWQSQLGGNRNVLGTSLYLGNAVYTVIGVAPPGFVGITDMAAPVAFVPVTTFAFNRSPDYFQNYHWGWLEVFARRKPGVSIEAANADLTAAYQRSWEAQRLQEPIATAVEAKAHAFITPVQLSRSPEAGPDSRMVAWVMGVALIVLLVACANVANLLLARALRRRREIALRLALGVSRKRLLQQLLVESLLLATLGGIAGLLAAAWGGRTLRTLFLRADEAVMGDNRTLLFAGATTLGVALIMGIAPALYALRADLTDALKAGAREGTYRRSRMRSALLLFQGALSVVLLIGAGLFVRSLQNVRATRLGYDVAPIVYAEANMRGMNLKEAEQNALNDRLLAATRATPGVKSATLTISVPFWSSEGRSLFVPGVDSIRKLGRFILQSGSPTYFETLGTRLLRGRRFTDQDRPGAPKVVIVSEAMAKAVWPNRDAIGQQIRIGRDSTPFSTVVGIAENVRGRSINGDPEFWYYLPIAQYGPSYPSLFARVNGDAEDFVEVLRRRLQREMPGASYVRVTTMSSFVSPRQRSWEFGATMFVAFGALALLLAAVGLYSVIAYAVAQRRHELGVRIALGAGTRDVIRMIVGQGVVFALSGIVIGSVIALWAGRFVEPLLFAQSARDPRVFVTVAAILLAVAVVATLRPAFRATRVNPTEALRAD